MRNLSAEFAARPEMKVCDEARGIIELVKDFSRPLKVAAHAAGGVTKTRANPIADEAAGSPWEISLPGFPQIRTCATNASGSSDYGLATYE